jgi:beta-glucosidase
VPRFDISSLPLTDQAALLSGRNMIHTKPIESAGIPRAALLDGPHGLRMNERVFGRSTATCFPPAVAIGSSWDPEVAARMGKAIGREAAAFGVAVVLGPGINIKRSVLCGRNFEYYSEDPLLAGGLGAAFVRALQEQGPGACVKHFAANSQETERMRISSDVDERTLREIYLPAFEQVVKEARPASVMCSYNKINGVYASQNHWLLTSVLRDEWGFEGAVVSDWGAVIDRVAALEAGLDLQMPGTGGVDDDRVLAAVAEGRISPSLVEASALRVGALIERMPEVSDAADVSGGSGGQVDLDAHHELARSLAGECIVLLKNDRAVLPLSPEDPVAVIGEFAVSPRYQGGGSSHVTPTKVTGALDAMRALSPSVTHCSGTVLDEALDAAGAAAVSVVFAGLGEKDESEGFDRAHIDLPAEQVELIRAVAAVSQHTVVVLSHGGVVSLEGWHDEVDAVVDGFLLGQAGGEAVADVLYGEVNPSGRLSETIPLRLEDTPSYINFPGESGHVRYGEGVMVGYRYYTTVERPVRYPFGHGLSYTTFSLADLAVEVQGTDSAVASVTVANTGDRAGKYVVQLYVSTTAGPVRRPRRELRAFTKVHLEPGASQVVELPLGSRAFAYYDVSVGRWVVAPGDYTIEIGDSSTDIRLSSTVALAGEVVVAPLTLESSVAEWLAHPEAGPRLAALLGRGGAPAGGGQFDFDDLLSMVGSMPMRVFTAFMGRRVSEADLVEILAAVGP